MKTPPEYPHKLAPQRNRPTAMRITGRISHCDVPPRAGQRKATSGNAGFASPVVLSRTTKSAFELGDPVERSFLFFRGRRDDGVEAGVDAMFSINGIHSSQWVLVEVES